MSITPNPPRVKKRVTHPEGGESRTQQNHAAATDINSIMSRYIQQGGSLPERPHSYGDFSSGITFHEAQDKVIAARDEFERLPVAVKRYCNQDVGEFLDLVYNPDRRGELEDLGLVEQHTPEAAPEANPPAAEPTPSEADPGPPAEEASS